MEVLIMKWQLIACVSVALVGASIFAQEKRAEKRADRLDALSAKLGLNDQQKTQARKIYEELEKKMEPVCDQLARLHHEEYEAMAQVLTEEQRRKAPEVIKKFWDKEWQTIGQQLGLSDEQKQQIQKLRETYHKQFHELAAQKGEKIHFQMRELRHEFLATVRQQFNEEQRIRFPGVLHDEFQKLREPAARRDHLKAIAEELRLNDDQRDRLNNICTEYLQKTEELEGRFKQLCQEERKAFENILTEQQRAKWQEIQKSHIRLEEQRK
jgi:Spy/CpxP family protein refolding chaperone